MCGIDEGIALDIEDDSIAAWAAASHASPAWRLTGRSSFRQPIRSVFIQWGLIQVVGEVEGYADLVFGDLAAGVHQLVEHGAGVRRAGIDDCAAG